MMSIFASPFCAPQTSEPSLVPLFRLLDDFDHYSRDAQVAPPQTKKPRQTPARLPRFKPRFDVRETEHAYELHGELPGIERENLNIEFTDPRTLQVRGRVERTKEEQPEPEQTTPEAGEADDEKTAASRNSHRATVEDDPEETASNASWTSVGSPKPEPETAKKAATDVEKASRKEPVANNTSKIWLWERSIGEFSRTFTFPTDVEHENVTAGLNNGVLTVTVPKQKKITPRRIAIN